MKVGSNYHGVNIAKEKARDNFAAEINQLKTEKTEDVDKVKRDYDVRLKNNVRANREWANTAIQEREKDFLSELQSANGVLMIFLYFQLFQLRRQLQLFVQLKFLFHSYGSKV